MNAFSSYTVKHIQEGLTLFAQMTGRVTPAATIGSISSGRTEERIWTGFGPPASWRASNGSATPKPAQSVSARAAA